MNTPQRTTWRTVLRRAAAYAALGLLTTVAAAWGLAFRDINDPGGGDSSIYSEQVMRPSPGPPQRTAGREANGLTVRVGGKPGACWLKTSCTGPEHQPLPGIPYTIGFVDVPPLDLVPGWARAAATPWMQDGGAWPRGHDWDWREVDGRGWPLVALYSVEGSADDRSHFHHGGWSPMPTWQTWKGSVFFGTPKPVTFPFYPAWSGLTVDTVFFAALWAAIFLGWSSARAWRRRVRGLCPACGYDLRGLPGGAPCPECGTSPEHSGL